MKRKKAALYDPYLDTLGGGERYILSILKVLEDNGYDPVIFWDTDISAAISQKLHIPFNKVSFQPTIFHTHSSWKKFKTLQEYDIVLYVTDGSYFFSSAHKTIIYCMVPDKKLYTRSLVNRLKTRNSTFLTHSRYVQEWLNTWGIQAKLLYPYIDKEFLTQQDEAGTKEPIILSVGRFFKHLHSKRHDVAITMYLKLMQLHPQFHQYKLILAGGLADEDRPYFEELVQQAGGNPSIVFQPNIPFGELVNLYKKAHYYWHCAGRGVDEQNHPELVEHLGISPLEAMAAGCITFCYKAGGPKELIQDGTTGYLYTSEQELIENMNKIHENTNGQESMRSAAQGFVRNTFSYEAFAAHVMQLFSIS